MDRLPGAGPRGGAGAGHGEGADRTTPPAKDRDGMSRAGLITGTAGVLALVSGIYLMMTAVPDFSIQRAGPP